MSRATEPRRCPICSKPEDTKFRPFCSRHCADIDLGRWLGGGYAIPAVEEDGGAQPSDDEDGADDADGRA